MPVRTRHTQHHPVVVASQRERANNAQLRVADSITAFSGSMLFVYLHVVLFAAWMIFAEGDPWPKLTLIVSLEAIFLSTFVLIGQNRQAEFAHLKADHDFLEQEQELKLNTELTEQIHELTRAIHARVVGPDAAHLGNVPSSEPDARRKEADEDPGDKA